MRLPSYCYFAKLRSLVPTVALIALAIGPIRLPAQTIPIADSTSGTTAGGGASPVPPPVGDNPLATGRVPLKSGYFDAVSKKLNLSIPLGPKLPGRIPFGFTWVHDEATPRWIWSGFSLGGQYTPVIWPSAVGYSPRMRGYINGSPIVFLKQVAVPLPSASAIRGWLAARHVDGASTWPIDSIYASPDGLSFYTVGNSGKAQAMIQGSLAIWTTGPNATSNPPIPGVVSMRDTYITNLGGDRILMTEGFGQAYSGLQGFGDGTLVPAIGSARYIKLVNTQATAHWITLTISVPSNTSNLGQFDVTNGMGLPAVTVAGYFREQQRTQWNSGYSAGLGVWDIGITPTRITYTAPNDPTPQVINLSWYMRLISGTQVSQPDLPLQTISYPNGLVEKFSNSTSNNGTPAFEARPMIEDGAFDFSTGTWKGFSISGTLGVQKNGSSMDCGIDTITFTGPGIDRSVEIISNWPVYQVGSDGISYTWLQPDHSTCILDYPTSTPSSSTPFRGYRLTHPSGVLQASATSAQAYLFVTSAILMAEKIHGSGLPVPVTGYSSIGSGASGFLAPSNLKVDQATTFDGWDLACWGNPTGALSVGSGLPIVPTAVRITTTTPGLPTQVRLWSQRDTAGYGYTRTDETTSTPSATPTVDPRATTPLATSVSLPSAPVQHTGLIQARDWDSTLGLLLIKQEQKSLTGSALPALIGAPSEDFGIWTYSNRDAVGQPKTKTLVRGGMTQTENLTYAGTTPVVTDTTASLTVPDQTSVGFSGQAGKTYTTDGSSFKWIMSEKDKISGRISTINSRDSLGRVTLSTDPDGIQTQTEYDPWGRLWHSNRLAKGAAGSLNTTYTYASDGSSKTETVTVDGHTLTTTIYYDALGEEVERDLPDGRVKKIAYDGFGQKTTETPALLPQESYGTYRWDYDEEGRTIASWDPQGRLLGSMYNPSDSTHTVQIPVWDDGMQGVVSRAWDDTGHLRIMVHDLLGHLKTVVDQKGQVSSYSYDGNGHLIATDQGGQSRQYRYNDAGWLLSRTEPEEGTTLYSDFTIQGVPCTTTQTGRSGSSQVIFRTELDGHARPVHIVAQSEIPGQSASVVSLDRSLTYTSGTSLLPATLQETQPYGTVQESYGYDDLLRMNSKSISDGQTTFSISGSYFDAGGLNSLTYPSGGGTTGKTVTVSYDALNRPTDVFLGGVKRGHKDYDQSPSATGYFDKLTYGNGATTTSTMSKGELVNVVHSVLGDSTLNPLTGNQQVNAMAWTAGGLLLSRGGDTFQYDDLKRLQSATIKGLNPGESMQQSFVYDRYGNRTSSTANYTAGTGGTRPAEALTWTASYDPALNALPSSVTSPSGALSTGVQYDDLGRISQVWAVPGQSSTLTSWQYDDTGRVVKENGTSYLLDGQGLRFKKSKADGSVQYTVYGFNREPLSTFEVAAPTTTSTFSTLSASTQSTSKGKSTSPTLQSLATTNCTALVTMDLPIDGSSVMAGYPLKGHATVDVDATCTPVVSWSFGDGGMATGLSVSHTYVNLGTFPVSMNAPSGGETVYVTVTKPPAPSVSSFTTTGGGSTGASVLIVKGQSAVLNWAVTGVLLSTSIDNGVGAQPNSGSVTVSPKTTTTYTLTSTNLGGTTTARVTVNVMDITTFSSTSNSINLGQSATLNWVVTGGTGVSVTVNQGVGSVSTSGSKLVAPTQTTTYTLTASCAAGTLTKSVTVGLNAPVIGSFTASSARIALGTSSTLAWSVTGASRIQIMANGQVLNTIGSPVPTTGSLQVTPTTTTEYTLQAFNATSSSMDYMTVTVVAPPELTGFSASPASIVAGDAGATLVWNAYGYDALTLSDGTTTQTVVASGVLVKPTSSRTYTLTASNIAGTVSRTCTVTVKTVPIIRAFTVSKPSIPAGQSVYLIYDVDGATTLSITPVTLPLGANSVQVSPTVTTTYILTASNASGSASASVKVTVTAPVTPKQPTLTRSEVMVYGFGQLLSEEKSTGTFYVQSDQVGSPNLITNVLGVVVGKSKNLPFGERFGQMGEKSIRRYTNHEDDPDSLAIYMQARTYLAAYGKFAQVDPAYDQVKQDPETWNLYNYVTNNPVTSTDPDGRDTQQNPMNAGYSQFWADAGMQSMGSTSVNATNKYFNGSYIGWTDEDHMVSYPAQPPSAQPEIPAGPPPPPGGSGQGRSSSAIIYSIKLLGQNVPIFYAPGVTDDQKREVSGELVATSIVINGAASRLSQSDINTIHQVTSLRIVNDDTYLGIERSGRLTLSVYHMAHSNSPEYLASLFPHEGQHRLNWGKYSGENLWLNEQSATRTQIRIGKKLGLSVGDQESLAWYSSDANREKLQEHMVNGYH